MLSLGVSGGYLLELLRPCYDIASSISGRHSRKQIDPNNPARTHTPVYEQRAPDQLRGAI